jgi:nucleoside-diphosphate-sugar epimerase
MLSPTGAISAIHASDLADGILLAATHSAAAGRTYFLSGPEAPSTAELLRLIAKALDRRSMPVPVPSVGVRVAGRAAEVIRDVTGRSSIFDRWKAEEIVVGNWRCSADRARTELGFQPRIPLAEGLRATAAWYQERGWL